MNTESARTVTGCWPAVTHVLDEGAVRSIFGLPGDDLSALDAVADSGLRLTLCRDQRNAVFMATGYAIQSGELGVALVGKGPAVTNTLTGLLEARSSAVPVLLVSGGTASKSRGSGAFQELDQVAALAPMVKWATRVDHPDRVVPTLRRALLVARGGAPGPVYVELPDHLLDERIPLGPPDSPEFEGPVSVRVDAESPALRAVRAADRPLVLVGGGMRHRNEDRLVERFAERFGAAVACTASGRGAVDESDRRFAGLSGLYAPEPSLALWSDVDCVLALGSRLEETAVHGWPDRLGGAVPVVQVNVDAAELSTEFAGPKVCADGRAVLEAWLEHGPERAGTDWSDRVAAVHEELLAAHRRRSDQLRDSADLHIAEVLEAIDEVVPPDRILVQENGLQDMWSYSYPLHSCGGGAGSVVPSEQTSLGFGAAAAIGVRQAAGRRPVVAFVGDGAMHMVAADLPTAVEQDGGILYVVLNNGGYGWLQSQLDQRGASAPDFSFVASAAVGCGVRPHPGLHQFTVDSKAALVPAVTEAWAFCERGRTAVLDVAVRLEDAVFAAQTGAGDFPLSQVAE